MGMVKQKTLSEARAWEAWALHMKILCGHLEKMILKGKNDCFAV